MASLYRPAGLVERGIVEPGQSRNGLQDHEILAGLDPGDGGRAWVDHAIITGFLSTHRGNAQHHD